MRIARNFGIVSLGLGFSKALYFIALILVARLLKVDQFGKFTEAFAFAALFVNVMDFGFSSLVTRELTDDNRAENTRVYLRDLFVAKLLPVSFSLLVIVVTSRILFDSSELQWLVTIFAIGFAAISYQTLIDGIYYAKDKPFMPVLFAVSHRALFVVFAPITLWFLRSPLAAAGWFSASASVVIVYAFRRINQEIKILPLRLRYLIDDWSRLRNIFHQGLGLAILGLVTSAYVRIDLVLLGRIAGNNATGIYGSAYRVFEMLLFFGMAYRIVIYPIVSELRDRDHQKLSLIVTETVRLTFLLIIPLAIALAVLAPFIINLLLGPQYADAAPIFSILMGALPFALINNTMLFVLLALKDDSIAIRFASIALAINVILNLLLIPKFGPSGPAFVTILTEFLMFTMLITRAWKLNLIRISQISVPRLLSAILLPVWVIPILISYSSLLAVTVYLILFMVMIWSFRMLTPFEVNMISRVFNKLVASFKGLVDDA